MLMKSEIIEITYNGLEMNTYTRIFSMETALLHPIYLRNVREQIFEATTTCLQEGSGAVD